ncbi:MAG TPA: GreA/GreB family elongation factor [Candidatus Eisenbacteria bacterium]|nr:GreA/GreB family elongation factor [Candidatus Eisenbacteria bacterium]
MPIREDLPEILRGEKHAELSPESRAALESLAAEAAANDQTAFVRDECAARLKQPGASPAVDYLLAAACALRGERERALQALLSLGDRLSQSRQWEPLAAVAERALELDETAAGARLLVRAHEGLRKDPERVDALWRAWRILPDDLELGLLLAVRLGDSGQASDRRALLAELAPRFAAEGRYAGLEEAALEFVEHLDLEALRHVIEVIPQVAAKGAVKEAKTLLDVAFPPLAAAAQAGEVEGTLREIVRQAFAAGGPAAAESFRAAVVDAIRQGTGQKLPDAAAVFALCGLSDHLKPLTASLERYDAIAVLPPGRAVLHGSFGAGRVAANDAENVIIDFTRSPSHRMPYAAARRSLTPLAEDDLRLLRFTQPADLERLRKEEPAEILVRALVAMGGEADAQKLKLFLVGNGLVPANEWTTTFRRLKAAAEKDPRIDHARAFEQHYRLEPEGKTPAGEEEQVPLPALEPRKPVKANLATMRKFLSQHPNSERALGQRFGRYLLRAMLDEEADRADRARAGLYVSRWYPERIPEWHAVLKTLWDQGLSISDLSGEEEQKALLEASHVAGVEADAILSGLDSRFSSVRELAARRREALDPAGRGALRRTLIDHAPRYPQAALRLIEQSLESQSPGPEPWRLLWAALALIEERPKPSLADKVLGWISEGGAFERLLAGQPCTEHERLKLTVLLRQWRSSDRYLFPALDLAQRVGLAEAVAAVRAARERSSRKLFEQVGKQSDVDLPVMTRATWERLKTEVQRMERELRTELPRTIQRARELGDLRENAEYHSAKLKQANLTKQVEALQKRLATARFVEDAEQTDGVAGLGTQVVLESDQDLVTYWILGEDEHHHGEQVVSFQAPVGRALMGKTIGEEVALGDRTYRVISVERKLPPSAPREPAAKNG